MEIISTPIPDLFIIKPKVFEDERGYFYESYSKAVFEKNGIHADFIQDNQSLSQKGVLRGLHFQNPPYAQGKLVRAIKGAILDIAVDIRKNSATYGHHFDIELNEQNKTMLWIPPGFAHGFLTLENNTIFSYKCSNLYNKASEDCILWNDPTLSINWGINDPILSDKDKSGKYFKDFESMF
ncbi:MAG: dTDP-4-dehydrorhamnose 3,5-epimerase [Bacteroidia bacterium]